MYPRENIMIMFVIYIVTFTSNHFYKNRNKAYSLDLTLKRDFIENFLRYGYYRFTRRFSVVISHSKSMKLKNWVCDKIHFRTIFILGRKIILYQKRLCRDMEFYIINMLTYIINTLRLLDSKNNQICVAHQTFLLISVSRCILISEINFPYPAL